MKFPLASLITAAFLGIAGASWGAPLSLHECVKKAHENNLTLKGAAWDIRLTAENSRLAAVSSYPRVDANAGYIMQLEPQAVKLGGVVAETQNPDFAFAGITATYTVYDFGRRDSRIRQAEALSESAVHTLEFSKSDVALQTVEAYFRILEAEKLIQAANEEIAQITEHRRVAQVLFDEGVVTRNDVLQAEVRLAAARQKLMAVANRRENGWLLLNFLTGREPGLRGELDENATLDSTVQATESAPGNVENRHDIKAQKRILEAREHEVKENRENYLPEIYAKLGLDYVQNDKVREQAIFSATLGVRVNLFDGYASQAAHEKAVKQRSKQLDSIKLAEQHAMLEMSTARNDADVAKERIAVTETAIKQGDENLRINRERYQERVGTASEVLDAQTLLTQAKTDHYRALFDFQTATARIRHALGNL